MSDCVLESGTLLRCPGVGGLDEIYISDWAKRVFAFTGEVIDGTDAGDGAAQTFETIQQDFETANADQPITSENGAISYAHTVVLTVYNNGDKNLDDEVRTLRKQLTKGRFLIMAKDNNGVHKLYGIKSGMKLTTSAGGNGQTTTELNGYVFTFVSNEPELARIVNIAGDGGGSTVEFIINAAPVA